MSANHTPLPWAGNNEGIEVLISEHVGCCHEIAGCGFFFTASPNNRAEASANAALIAAAPELLEALKTVLDGLGALSNPTDLENRIGKAESDRVFAAISKAEGRT